MTVQDGSTLSYEGPGYESTWADEARQTVTAAGFGNPDRSWALVEELMPDYRGVVSRGEVAGAIRRASSDLRGSICRDALPEMATRLARFRLDRLIEDAEQAGDERAADAGL
jgi:hypothetical protein